MIYLEEYINYLRSLNYADRTIERAELDLKQFFLYFDRQEEKSITPRQIKEYQQYLIETQNIERETITIKLKTVRRYFHYLIKRNYILVDPFRYLEFSHQKQSIQRDILSIEEIKRLMDAPPKDKLGIRDKTILELLYSTGMRNSELRRMNLSDIRLKEQEILIRDDKTRTERIIPMGRQASKVLSEYLLTVRPRFLHKNKTEPAVFLTSKGSRLNYYAVRNLFDKYIKQIGLPGTITPHCLRHSCATHMLQNGAPIEVIQELLGHQHIDSTEIYTRVMPEDLKQVLQKSHPHGTKKDI